MFYLRYLALFLLIFNSSELSWGQEKQGALRQFRCVTWNKELAKELKLSYFNKGNPIEIEHLSDLQLSEVYKWRGDGPLFMGIDGKPPTEATSKEKIVKISFKPRHTKCLIIFVPDEKKPSGVAAMVFDNETKKFPWGSYKFINGAGLNLTFWMDKYEMDIPNKSKPKLLHPKLPEKNVKVALGATDEEDMMFLNTVWKHRPDIRSWVLLMPSDRANLGAVHARVIDERKPRLIETNPG